MILKALKYGNNWLTNNWSIASGATHDGFVNFNNINLIVGRNASGKTKFIEALRLISDLLDGRSGNKIENEEPFYFELIFQDGNDSIHYSLFLDNNDENGSTEVCNEKLFVNDVNKLDRKSGQLYYEQLGQFVDFKLDNQYLAVERKDDKQQPFFKTLHDWGRDVSHYSFGGNMGKGRSQKDSDDVDVLNFKNAHNVRATFIKGEKDFSDNFKKEIIDDMKKIEYNLTDIISKSSFPKFFQFLTVQESDLPNETYFEDMSQGMARAFSLIVQLNYSLMAKIPSCILIDDIGEGLDYDRSKKLIELIIEKAEGSNIQVFMTTNDRFVMNSVPLKYWSVIHREGNKSVFYNYQNSKQTFDDFAFTGLNNFDFFATEFYRQGFEEFIATAQ
jgi:AAA15 family ATPase/GTPase